MLGRSDFCVCENGLSKPDDEDEIEICFHDHFLLQSALSGGSHQRNVK